MSICCLNYLVILADHSYIMLISRTNSEDKTTRSQFRALHCCRDSIHVKILNDCKLRKRMDAGSILSDNDKSVAQIQFYQGCAQDCFLLILNHFYFGFFVKVQIREVVLIITVYFETMMVLIKTIALASSLPPRSRCLTGITLIMSKRTLVCSIFIAIFAKFTWPALIRLGHC